MTRSLRHGVRVLSAVPHDEAAAGPGRPQHPAEGSGCGVAVGDLDLNAGRPVGDGRHRTGLWRRRPGRDLRRRNLEGAAVPLEGDGFFCRDVECQGGELGDGAVEVHQLEQHTGLVIDPQLRLIGPCVPGATTEQRRGLDAGRVSASPRKAPLQVGEQESLRPGNQQNAGSRSGDDLTVGLGQPGRRRISGVQEAGRRLQSVRLGPLVNEVDLDVLRRRDRSQRRAFVGEPAVAGAVRRVPPAAYGGVNVGDGRSG